MTGCYYITLHLLSDVSTYWNADVISSSNMASDQLTASLPGWMCAVHREQVLWQKPSKLLIVYPLLLFHLFLFCFDAL